MRKGFTVLEFLIVLAIIGILIALALAGLTLTQSREEDKRSIAKVQNVAIALQDFYNQCRTYPESLSSGTSGAQCPADTSLSMDGLIPDLASYDFNGTQSSFHYQGLSFTPNGPCTGYHISVTLRNEGNAFADRDSNFDSRIGNAYHCGLSGNTSGALDGATPGVYDIKK